MNLLFDKVERNKRPNKPQDHIAATTECDGKICPRGTNFHKGIPTQKPIYSDAATKLVDNPTLQLQLVIINISLAKKLTNKQITSMK